MENPYLDELKSQGSLTDEGRGVGFEPSFYRCECHGVADLYAFPSKCPLAVFVNHRNEMVEKYAWAIPDEDSIRRLAAYSPIVEMGAGSGYWAWMLEQAGADVLAFDNCSFPEMRNRTKGEFYCKVKRGTPNALKQHPDRSLLLCWPPIADSMASRSLKNYEGSTLIYVGEGVHGVTGDGKFHMMLVEDWEQQEEMHIPRWSNCTDYVAVYKRLTQD